MEKAVTIKDLAAQLGVAPSTISRALKDHYSISPEMKRRVIELANELNYSPNAVALSLKENRTHVIGVLLPEVVHYFFSTVLAGIEETATKKGYQVIMAQSNESYFREVANANALLSGRVDGLIASLTKETENVDHFGTMVKKRIPLTFFDRVATGLTASQVLFDDFQGAYMATEHLIKTGCRNIYHFAGPDKLSISVKRKEGYQKALADNGLSSEGKVFAADNSGKALETVNSLFAQGHHPDAIFTVNDETAAGALSALRRLGKKVPDEVSLVGFGDGPLSQLYSPSITTVNQAGHQMGRLAATILIDQVEKGMDHPTQSEVVPASLIVRESTKAL